VLSGELQCLYVSSHLEHGVMVRLDAYQCK